MSNSSYYESIKRQLLSVLRNNPCTFEEICLKCQGVYPILIRDLIKDLSIYNSLIPLYSTNLEQIPFDEKKYYFEENKMATDIVKNNPVLSSWYFSWNTCKRMGQLEAWSNKSILFLGTPRLFEYFLQKRFGQHIVLIDLDETVIHSLESLHKINEISSANVFCDDINKISPDMLKWRYKKGFDYIFLDPPWYSNYYFSWLNVALQLISPKGCIVFSLFPRLLRPTARAERTKLFSLCRSRARNVFHFSDVLEYDIPSFEYNELESEGLHLRSNWKASDLIIMSDIYSRKELPAPIISNQYTQWEEFNWLEMRWFLDVGRSFANEANLISSVNENLMLKNPSKRNNELLRANLLSSNGHGLVVSNPQRFLKIIAVIQNMSDPTSEIAQLDIDETSKNILKRIMGS